MTNLNHMLNLLMDISDYNEDAEPFERINIDDGGASEEAMVYYNIECPYRSGDDRCHCKDLKVTEKISRKMCSDCKYEWLLQEVDP